MKTMTVRDIRQHWPDAERALATEKEIISPEMVSLLQN